MTDYIIEMLNVLQIGGLYLYIITLELWELIFDIDMTIRYKSTQDLPQFGTNFLTLSPPNLKMSFGTTFTFNIILAFRKQRIELIIKICQPMKMS